jgi:hypothetical protein
VQKRRVRQRYFVPKELRYSVAIMVIFSMLAGVLFIYLAKALGGLMAGSVLPFVLILAGYFLIVVLFTLLFSHRFIGPFERLKLELKLFRAGDHDRRLNLRKNDDIYIRSFIIEINHLLADYEKAHRARGDLIKAIDFELMDMIAAIEKKDLTRDEQIGLLVSFHRKVKTLVEKSG